MALADTANLVVALKLKDQISGPLRNVGTQIDALARRSSVRGGLSQIGQGIGLGIQRGSVIAIAGIGAISTQIAAGVSSLRELESVEAQTRAGIESTGGAAGQTAQDIRRLAEKYEDIGGILDDKVIQAGENVLLTFTNIRDDAFEPTLEAALDLSTRMGTDLETAALQLGKALNDPIGGLTALRRVGVQFTDQQEEQIRRYVELGDTASAQQVILDEVNREFGGSFEEAGKTSEATIGRFKDSVEGLQQNLATAFIPAIDRVARKLNELFSDPDTQAAVRDFGERLAGFLNEDNLNTAIGAVKGVFGYLAEIPWGTIGDGLRITGDAAKVAIDAFKSLPPGVQNALITLLAANKLTGGLVASGLGQLAGVALGALKTIMAGNVTVIGKNVTGGGGGLPSTGGGGRGGKGGGLSSNLLNLLIVPALVGAAQEAVGSRPWWETPDSKTQRGTLPKDGVPVKDTATAKAVGDMAAKGDIWEAQSKAAHERTRAAVAAGTSATAAGFAALNSKTGTLIGKGESIRAAAAVGLAGVSGRIGTTNAKLDTANSRLAGILSKNTSPIVKVTNVNRVSSTVIQQSTTQQRALSGSTTSRFQPGY